MVSHIVRTRTSRGRVAAPLAALLLATVVSLTAVAPAHGQDDPPVKVAVIDIDFIAVQSPSGQALAAEISALQDRYNTELAARQAEVDDISARIAAVDSMDVAEQRVLQREYQDAVTSFQRFQQDMQAQAQTFQTDGLQRVRDEIGPALEEIMRSEGYDLILSTGNPGVVMTSERIDITQLVLDHLRAGAVGG